MRLDRPTPLPAASFLQLMWLASPALPVGGFSYSEGLESAIENAGLASEAAVGDWLLDQLHITQARGDMARAMEERETKPKRVGGAFDALSAPKHLPVSGRRRGRPLARP